MCGGRVVLVASSVLIYYPKDHCQRCEQETDYSGWDIEEDEEEILVLFFCRDCGGVKTERGMEWIEDQELLEEIVRELGKILGEEGEYGEENYGYYNPYGTI